MKCGAMMAGITIQMKFIVRKTDAKPRIKPMSQFKIVRTSEGVFAKEVNPYPESSPFIESRKEAESQLKEYPLTEENQDEGGIVKNGIVIIFEIGQIIQGELVVEEGVKKIKI